MKHFLKDNLGTFSLLLFLSAYTLIFNNTSGWTVFFLGAPIILVCTLINLNIPRYDLKSKSIISHSNKDIDLSLHISSPLQSSLHKFFSVLKLKDVTLTSSSYSVKDNQIHMTFKHSLPRGSYPLTKLNIYQSDLLSVVKRRILSVNDVSLHIYPSLLEALDIDLLSILNKLMLDKSYYPDQSDIQVRDLLKYEYGMPVKNIHWKALAKSKDILVKNFDYHKEIKPSLIFFPGESINFECALSSFYTLAYQGQSIFGLIKILDREINPEFDKTIFLNLKAQKITSFTAPKNALIVTPFFIDQTSMEIFQMVVNSKKISIYAGNQIVLQIDMNVRRINNE